MENQPKTTNTQVGQNNSQKTPVVLICVLGKAKNTKSGQKCISLCSFLKRGFRFGYPCVQPRGSHSCSHFKYKRYKYSPHVVVMLQFAQSSTTTVRTKDRLQVAVLGQSRDLLA